MKREGRQHGIVSTYTIHRAARGSDKLAGGFAKVSSKPTNQSRHTGKCYRTECRCYHHLHPACKSKNKVKGMQKMRSASDVVSNGRLITWRVVDAGPGFKNSGFSATGVLDYLEGDLDMGASYESEYNGYGDGDLGVGVDAGSRIIEIEEIEGNDDDDVDVNDDDDLDVDVDVDVDDDDDDDVDVDVDDDDDRMSFCEIGFLWREVEGDESWCFVEEL